MDKTHRIKAKVAIKRFGRKYGRRVLFSVALWSLISVSIYFLFNDQYWTENYPVSISEDVRFDKFRVRIDLTIYPGDEDLYTHRDYRCEFYVSAYALNHSDDLDDLELGMYIENTWYSIGELPISDPPEKIYFPVQTDNMWDYDLFLNFQSSGDLKIHLVAMSNELSDYGDKVLTQTIPVQSSSVKVQEDMTRWALVTSILSIGIASWTIILGSKIDDKS